MLQILPVVAWAIVGTAPLVSSRLPAVVLPPAATSTDGLALALAIEDRASSLLEQTQRYLPNHIKQVSRMAEHEGLDLGHLTGRSACAAAGHLGAGRFASGELRPRPDGSWELTHGGQLLVEAPCSDGAPPSTLVLSADWAEAVDLGGHALANDIAHLDGIALPDSRPPTRSDVAMHSYARCFQALVKQPIGIESPTLLLDDDLQAAEAACQRATDADPGFDDAWAGLALGQAIRGDDAAAVKTLGHQTSDGVYLPLRAVARFWLVTRYQSSAAGTQVLRAALGRHPGSLLLMGYLAEHLAALGQPEAALVAWQSYLAASPRNPFVLAQMGATLGHLGRREEAIERTREALAIDPGSRELKLDLASRELEAGRFGEAVSVLTPLVQVTDAEPEAVLRLGSAQFEIGNLEAAEPLFERAIRAASRADEWRTRGQANLGLARIALRQRRPEVAEAHLLAALAEGYKPLSLLRADPDLAAFADRVMQSKKGGRAAPNPAPKPHPKEASPFSLSGSGEIEPDEKRPPPPYGFELFRFDL